MLDRVVSSDSEDTKVCPHRERRAAVRYRLPVERIDRCALADAFRSQEGPVLNLCASGVGLMLPCQVAVGTKVFLQLRGSASDETEGPELIAKVICAEPHQTAGWLIWCALKNALTEEQVQALR